ncbi:ribose-phosphate pyrophosphokinase [Alicyclobacillus sp. SO9]|nr:ribose-phosphate pyrophosphokinase [Alicyclobacillus sp. SO9]
MKIFAGSSGKQFAERICSYLHMSLGSSEAITFSDGNTFVRIKENVRGTDVYLVQPIGLSPNNEFVEILFWIDAFKRASANSVTVVIPYFGYAKGDKKDEPRVSIRARVCADAIETAGVDRIIMMDLHAPQIQGFFKKPVDHLIALPLLSEYIKAQGIENFVIVSPDAGFAKQARKFSSYLGVSTVIGDKRRTGHDENPETLELIGEVNGKNAIIVDDFSTSGGTLIDLSHLLKRKGALSIFACLSHLLLSPQAVERIEASPIEYVISTDSVENHAVNHTAKIRIISAAPLFGEAIRRIYMHQSVSGLFEGLPPEVLEFDGL